MELIHGTCSFTGFYPATADLAREMQPVCRGLGDLLLQSHMTHSGIAVFYSLPSALATSHSRAGSMIVMPSSCRRRRTPQRAHPCDLP